MIIIGRGCHHSEVPEVTCDRGERTLKVTDKAGRLIFGVICAVNIQPPTNQKKDLECLQILVKLTKIVQKVPI